jgi:hypothetical protein
MLITAAAFGQSAVFSVNYRIAKFPKTQEGRILHYTYIVTNKGKVPLTIFEAQTECSCTEVILPKKPIAPGEKDRIEVFFDTNGKYFFQDRLIILKTNTRRKKEKLRLRVFVVPKEVESI